MMCLVFSDFRLPPGYRPRDVDLLLRLNPGYPDIPPDMFWCKPFVTYSDGTEPVAANSKEDYLGEKWQRFSRHLSAGIWRPGHDGLETYLSLILSDLERAGNGQVP